MSNSFGKAVTVTLFGESHGPAIGAVLDGIAPGVYVDLDYIKERANANHNEINTAFMTLQNQIANQSAAIEAQFNALKDQKIADQAA